MLTLSLSGWGCVRVHFRVKPYIGYVRLSCGCVGVFKIKKMVNMGDTGTIYFFLTFLNLFTLRSYAGFSEPIPKNIHFKMVVNHFHNLTHFKINLNLIQRVKISREKVNQIEIFFLIIFGSLVTPHTSPKLT